MKTDNKATGIKGCKAWYADGNPVDMSEGQRHYYVCQHCGQSVDMRDLGQVFHHERDTHKPLKLDS